MKRKDQFLLPVTLAFALAAAPVLAQSTGAQGGATGNTGATGTDSRPSTAQGSTTTPSTTTPGTTATTPGSSATMGSTGTTGTTTMGSTSGAMGNLAADSVLRHRPRLSQLIGTNVYNDRNETIGEVDDIILATPAVGMGTTGSSTTGTTTMGSTTGSTTSGATTPGASTTATPSTTMPSTGMSSMEAPMAVIQVGGFLGMGGRLVMVPISELQWNAERERVILPNATKESLQGRPAFTYDSLRRG